MDSMHECQYHPQNGTFHDMTRAHCLLMLCTSCLDVRFSLLSMPLVCVCRCSLLYLFVVMFGRSVISNSCCVVFFPTNVITVSSVIYAFAGPMIARIKNDAC